MEGYIVTLKSDSQDASANYWDGVGQTQNLDAAKLYQLRSDARLEGATLQSIYPDHDISVLPALRSIEIIR
jgi:hypothetical protein